MEVKDFSREIVESARGKVYRLLPDYSGALAGGTAVNCSHPLITDLIFSNPLFHISGAASGAASFLIRKATGRYVDTKLTRHVENPNFLEYGLNSFYDAERPVNLKEEAKNLTLVKKIQRLPSPKSVISYVMKDMPNYSDELFDFAAKLSKHLPSELKKHRKLSLFFESSDIVGGAVLPHVGYGAMVYRFFDFLSKSAKSREIGKALEIGDEVKRRIEEGSSKEEIEKFLEGLKH